MLADLSDDPATAQVPVVVASVVDERARGLALGAADYLIKPVSRDDLLGALARVGVPVGTAPLEAEGSRHERERILVVEDNPLNLKLVRDVLGAPGTTSWRRPSGEEGLRLAAEQPPDLVLHGPPAARASTAPRPCSGCASGVLAPDVPVVAVTAFAMAEDHARAAHAGFDAYLEKPISVRAWSARSRG